MWTRKRILNVTSRKKKDTMQPTAGEQSTAADPPTLGPRRFVASDGQIMVMWCPTKRRRDTFGSPGNVPTVDDPACRTATECFYRGLKERINISTSGSSSWRWRRICFTFKSDRFLFNPDGPLGVFTRLDEGEPPYGYLRGLNAFNFGDTFQRQMAEQIQSYMFQGTSGIDWNSTYTAKTDGERINVKYDKTRIISSGNDAGVMRDYNIWHPMNKNLVYDEDEEGGTQQNGSMSAMTKRSMGDYYVVDFIGCNDNNAEELIFNPTATLYWHER